MPKIDTADAIRLYVEEGLTLVECARKLGSSRTGIEKALIRHGIDRRSKTEHLTKIDVTEAIRLYVDERLSLDECGRRLGVTGPGVKRALAKNGIRIRSLSEQAMQIDAEEAKRLYVDEGLSLDACGKRMGFEATGIRAALIRTGIDTSRGTGWRRGKSKGRFVTSQGYVLVYAPDHPNAKDGRYVFEHRLVMELRLGRYLTRTEVVHHINGDRADNRDENLQLFANNGDHLRHTLFNRWSRHFDACVICGTTERRHARKGMCYLCRSRIDTGRNPLTGARH